MKDKIVLVGGGGHCKVIIDAIISIGKYEIEGILDPQLSTDINVLGVPVLGDDDKLRELYENGVRNAFIGAGSTGNCGLRKTLYRKISEIGFEIPVIIHPKAVIAHDVKDNIEEGTFIAASATVNPGTKIGRNTIINTSSSIDHDCGIDDFAHIAPGVTLSGGVKVGAETHIGTGANVIQYLNIGKNCMIKAGELVTKDVPDSKIWSNGKYDD